MDTRLWQACPTCLSGAIAPPMLCAQLICSLLQAHGPGMFAFFHPHTGFAKGPLGVVYEEMLCVDLAGAPWPRFTVAAAGAADDDHVHAGSFHMVNTRAQRLRCPEYRADRFLIVPSSVNYFVRRPCWPARPVSVQTQHVTPVLHACRTSCSWATNGLMLPAGLAHPLAAGHGSATLTGSSGGGAGRCCTSRHARGSACWCQCMPLELLQLPSPAGQVQPPALFVRRQQGQRGVRMGCRTLPAWCATSD